MFKHVHVNKSGVVTPGRGGEASGAGEGREATGGVPAQRLHGGSQACIRYEKLDQVCSPNHGIFQCMRHFLSCVLL